MRYARVALVIVAVVCFGVALSYPIRYRLAEKRNNEEMAQLSAMRTRVREEAGGPTELPGAKADEPAETPEGKADGDDAAAVPKAAVLPGEPAGAGMPPEAEAALTADMPAEAEARTEAESRTEDEAPAVIAEERTEAEGRTEDETQAVIVEERTEDSGPTPISEGRTEDEAPTVVAETGEDEAPAAIAEAGESEAPAVIAEGQAEDEAPTVTDEAQAETEARAVISEERTDAEAPAEVEAPVAITGSQTEAEVPREDAEGPVEVEVLTTAEARTEAEILTPTPTPGIMDLILDYEPWPTPVPVVLKPVPTRGPGGTPTPAPTFDVAGFTGVLPYPLKEKVLLDEDAILPELREIYELNHDLVGWLTIPDTVVDYPVVQRPSDSDFYLTHDFYGEENQNGQLILDPQCDPYTPSYNLVISGHHMKNGSMFGDLPAYRSEAYWRKHAFLEFDTLMARKQYVVFAAFYSADYDEDEQGFRYNVNVRYRMDADAWIAEIRENQLYDTGIDVKFGDEFITLTTCYRARHRNGRFVVVCRKIREGETFE